MSVQATGIQTPSSIPKNTSKIEFKTSSSTWTLDQIRGMRQQFEQETSAMVKKLGDSEHQTMLGPFGRYGTWAWQPSTECRN